MDDLPIHWNMGMIVHTCLSAWAQAINGARATKLENGMRMTATNNAHATNNTHAMTVVTEGMYDNIPVPLRPLREDWDDAVAGMADWQRLAHSCGKDGLVTVQQVLEPWQSTYKGEPIDGSVGDIDVDATVTDYEEALEGLQGVYRQMSVMFDYRDKHHRLRYDVARMVAHWGRHLSDEVAWLKAHGARSSFTHVETQWEKAQKAKHQRVTELKEQWDREHPGEPYPVFNMTYSPWELEPANMKRTVYRSAEGACVLQGRPSSDVKGMARRVFDEFDAINAAGDLDDEARRNRYAEAINAMYTDKPMTDEPVTLIDIETSGLDAASVWIQDIGWCHMRLNDPHTELADKRVIRFSMSESLMGTGNPTQSITGITVDSMRGLPRFDMDREAQNELLAVLMEHPYMAHNARFEDANFKAQVKGYAEARRNGDIRIIDSMIFSRRLDSYDGKESNKLEDYAKRWGAIAMDEGERHLGLEDAEVMGVAFGRHMQSVFARLQGEEYEPESWAVHTGRRNGETY